MTTWEALSDGGELRWIDDPRLLELLATAYFRIETTRTLERQMLELEWDPLWRTTGWQTIPKLDPMPEVRRFVEVQDEHTIAAIDDALEGVGGIVGRL